MTGNALSEGIRLYNTNCFKDALAFFLGLPEEVHVDSMELMYYIGLCYSKLGRYEDALLYLEQVVTAGKNQDSYFTCLQFRLTGGMAYYDGGSCFGQHESFQIRHFAVLADCRIPVCHSAGGM